jgi:signal peptidase I
VKSEVPKAAGGDQNPSFEKRVRQEVISWLWVILAFLLIEGTLVQARVIPSASMEKTVLIGDHLIVSRIGYDAGMPFTPYHIPLWRNPHRQQVIVFRAPLPGTPDYIKRTIGLPGDELEVRSGVVYIDGQALEEPYRNGPALPEDNYGPVQIPPGKYFMMGDNRNDSYDSRYWGFVPRENIVGTPLFVYMSIDAPEDVWEPGHLGERMGAYLSAIIHPGEVRWSRLFRTF